MHWRSSRLIATNERLSEEQRCRVGYFVLHDGAWWLVNERLPDLMDADTREAVPVGGEIELNEGQKLLLSKAKGGRPLVVQMAAGS